MNANNANKSKRKRVKSASTVVNTANKHSVSSADVDSVVDNLTTMYKDGYTYRDIAEAVSRTSGWAHNVINGGRFSVRRSDVIAARAARKASDMRRKRTRKHDSLSQSIISHCVGIIQNVEELVD